MGTNITLKGVSVTPGFARGKLYVATSMDDILNCPPGCILVVRTATPDVILAFSKAAAMVTECGGTTCHAAILAREYGIPCVVSVQGVYNMDLHQRDAVLVASEGRLELY